MAELTDRRHYANSAAESALSVSIDAAVTTFTLTTTTGFPQLPFTAALDYQGPAEEVVLVTGLSGTTVTNCVRGYDGSAPLSHSLGASFVHSLAAVDLDEANDHTSSTAAHGTTGDVVGTTDPQTLSSKTIQSSTAQATATDPALKLKANASGTAQLLEGYDSAGSGLLIRAGRAGDLLVSPNDPARKPIVARGAAAQSASLIEAQDSSTLGLWIVDASGRILHRPSDLTSAAYKHVPPDATVHTFLQLRNNSDSADQFLLTTAGEIIRAAKLWLAGIGSDDALRFPLDGSKFKVDSAGNVSGNNLPTVRSADKGKLQQWGTFPINFSNANNDSGTLTFPQPFGSASGIVVVGTVLAGSNFDLALNWQSAPTVNGVTWRVFQKDANLFTGSGTVHWFAAGPA